MKERLLKFVESVGLDVNEGRDEYVRAYTVDELWTVGDAHHLCAHGNVFKRPTVLIRANN